MYKGEICKVGAEWLGDAKNIDKKTGFPSSGMFMPNLATVKRHLRFTNHFTQYIVDINISVYTHLFAPLELGFFVLCKLCSTPELTEPSLLFLSSPVSATLLL